MAKFQPVIKWSGSKRSQVEMIVSHFPKKINTYYEPFVGGGSIIRGLLESDIIVKEFICSDINNDLILLWNHILINPKEVYEHYATLWNELNKNDDLERKKMFFYEIRERYNRVRNPLDFLFISRTTTNGLIRYNKQGEFNNSFHVTRNGINPETLKDVIFEWSTLLNNSNVKFMHQSYNNVQGKNGDFIYCDPPYAGTKGMYYGTIDYTKFWSWLQQQDCSYALSFDGTCGTHDRTYQVGAELYDIHEYIYSGVSSFKRLKEQTIEHVSESLYLKFR